MKAPPAPTSQSPPASTIGENIHCDILPISTSIGGNNNVFFTVDDKSDYVIAVPMQGKSTKQLVAAMDVVIRTYQQHGHTVKHFTSDDEANLKATLPHLLIRKITHSTTPAGLHEKKAERSVQKLKSKLSSIKAGLSYVLPTRLECEAIMAAVDQLNSLPTTNTGTTTPLQAFTGRKPIVPAFAFGTIGVMYHPRQDDKTLRGEIGIFLSHGAHRRYIKAFIPTRDKTYSVRLMQPLKEQVTPLSWKFHQNIRGVQPIRTQHFHESDRVQLRDPEASHDSLTNPTSEHLFPIDSAPTILNKAGDLNTLKDNGSLTTPILIHPLENPSSPSQNQTLKRSLNQEGAQSFYPRPDQEGDTSKTMGQPSLLQESHHELIRTTVETNPQSGPMAKGRSQPSISSPQNTTLIQPSRHNHQPSHNHESNKDQRSQYRLNPQRQLSPFPARNIALDFPSTDAPTPTPSLPQLSKFGRILRPNRRYLYLQASTGSTVKAYKTTITNLLQDPTRKDRILASIKEEVDNLMSPGIMDPVPITSIAFRHRPDIIRLWLFHKEKYDAKGTFLKDKCRIVTLSQSRDTSQIGMTYSPTVNPISFFVMMAIVATRMKYSLAAYDIKGAFLNSKIDDNTYVYVKADKDLATWFSKFHPHLVSQCNSDGSLIFRLRRYLYGLQESPLAWNNTLHNKLKSLGFVRSVGDQCLYIKNDTLGCTYLTVHVDDMMLAFPGLGVRTWFEHHLRQWYQIVVQDRDITYLGMSVTKSHDGIRVHQRGYIDTLCDKFSVSPDVASTSPTGSNFLQDNPKDVEVNVTKYLGLVMSLMYLARFTRPDILMTVTYLATKSSKPTQGDYNKAIKVLSFVSGTKNRTLFFKAKSDLILKLYADAAHMLHKDTKGHGGIIGTLGSAPIFTKSFKFKLATRSSTESEMVALEETATFSLWLTILLRDFGLKVDLPITIYQDNLSTIAIVMSGGNFNRSKHMLTKYTFVKQYVDLGEIELVHCRTQVMAADMLTKPLTGSELKKLIDLISIVDE
jgi:Reverse transcriptase (RNA-dependent DNA polymerase)